MALNLQSNPCLISSATWNTMLPSWTVFAAANKYGGGRFRCIAKADQPIEPTHIVPRRSGNYHSNIWDDNYLQSLSSDFTGSGSSGEHDKLMDGVRHLIKETKGPAAQVELISDIQRLGLGYQFEKETNEVLDFISLSISKLSGEKDLYIVALCFRLLREHGYEISQDIFKAFMDENGCFMKHLCSDVKGMLSLYDASHLSFRGESVLDEAKSFSARNLENARGCIVGSLSKLVEHALELPLHWRLQRLEARWYIEEIYTTKKDMNPILLKLAKMDYNMVQAVYQEDLKETSRWWRNLGLAEKLPFARNRLVECFLWALGMASHPHFKFCRQELTKVTQFITIEDDLYDVYGTIDELELFTDAMERWDTAFSMEQLPEYMKMCYLAIFNTANELGYKILKEQGVDIIPTLKNTWADICKADLKEAKWNHDKYLPTLDEYLNNAKVSIGGYVGHSVAYVSMGHEITMDGLQCLADKMGLLHWSQVNFRLTDDWGTSEDEREKGDVPKSIECYMQEKGVLEATAKEHIRGLISETWKKMNENQVAPSPFPKSFVNTSLDVVRTSHNFYLDSDGFGTSTTKTRDQIMKIVVDPIPLD